jgi:hypothetical protein
MRLFRVLGWVIFLGVIGWASYSAVGAGWSYFVAQELVDKALREASARHRVAYATRTEAGIAGLTTAVRDSIIQAARHEGLVLDEDDVMVTTDSAGFSASIRWSYPVISFQGRDVFVIPLSLQRSTVVVP